MIDDAERLVGWLVGFRQSFNFVLSQVMSANPEMLAPHCAVYEVTSWIGQVSPS